MRNIRLRFSRLSGRGRRERWARASLMSSYGSLRSSLSWCSLGAWGLGTTQGRNWKNLSRRRKVCRWLIRSCVCSWRSSRHMQVIWKRRFKIWKSSRMCSAPQWRFNVSTVRGSTSESSSTCMSTSADEKSSAILCSKAPPPCFQSR